MNQSQIIGDDGNSNKVKYKTPVLREPLFIIPSLESSINHVGRRFLQPLPERGLRAGPFLIDLIHAGHRSYPEAAEASPPLTRSYVKWGVEVLDREGDVGRNNSIAVDADGAVHIIYFDSTNKDLKYATDTGGIWQIATIDSAGDVGEYCSMALDSYGNVHAVYLEMTNHSLLYITNAGGEWNRTVVDPDNVGFGTDIALDSSNNVHIAYFDDAIEVLRYAKLSGGEWSFSIIDNTGNAGKFCSRHWTDSGQRTYPTTITSTRT